MNVDDGISGSFTFDGLEQCNLDVLSYSLVDSLRDATSMKSEACLQLTSVSDECYDYITLLCRMGVRIPHATLTFYFKGSERPQYTFATFSDLVISAFKVVGQDKRTLTLTVAFENFYMAYEKEGHSSPST
jgi:type VI protein secretion system component Hcp